MRIGNYVTTHIFLFEKIRNDFSQDYDYWLPNWLPSQDSRNIINMMWITVTVIYTVYTCISYGAVIWRPVQISCLKWILFRADFEVSWIYIFFIMPCLELVQIIPDLYHGREELADFTYVVSIAAACELATQRARITAAIISPQFDRYVLPLRV